MSEKNAILIVSFGTSHLDTLERTIAAIEDAVRERFPERPVFRAFTSGIILKKLRERDGLQIDDVTQAMERLHADGYTDVIVQPTHIMNGEEYEKMLTMLAPYRDMIKVTVGSPMLSAVADYKKVCDALMTELEEPGENEAIVFVGHGTEHFANSAYCQMEYMLSDLGWKRAFFGTVEGYPTYDQVLQGLKEQPQIKKVKLSPFMIVAGDHAKNDIAGDDEDSWKSRLTQQGYKVDCSFKGLGEYKGIQQCYVDHIREQI